MADLPESHGRRCGPVTSNIVVSSGVRGGRFTGLEHSPVVDGRARFSDSSLSGLNCPDLHRVSISLRNGLFPWRTGKRNKVVGMLLSDGFGPVAVAFGVGTRRIYRRSPVAISSPHIAIGIFNTDGGLVRRAEVVEECGVSRTQIVGTAGSSLGRWPAW